MVPKAYHKLNGWRPTANNMNLEQQVCSVDLAKRLKELGVKQESLFLWCDEGLVSKEWRDESGVGRNPIAAFTVAELGEMLPLTNIEITGQDKGSIYFALYDKIGFQSYVEDAYTEADARAKMLCYLLKSNLYLLA